MSLYEQLGGEAAVNAAVDIFYKKMIADARPLSQSLQLLDGVPLLQTRVSIVRTVLTTPIIYGALAGLSVLLSGVRVPEWLADTTQTLGGVLIPLMLMALGHTIGGLRANNLPRAFGLGTARLAIAFVAAVIVSKLLGLTGVARGVLVLQGAMPAAVFSYLFAARYQRDAEDIAGIVLVSTLLGAALLLAGHDLFFGGAAFALLLGGELIERHLFFRAEATPKMPGVGAA